MMLNEAEIKELSHSALDAACLAIQTKLGVSDGLHASLYFSGDNEDRILSLMSEYIKSELQTLTPDSFIIVKA